LLNNWERTNTCVKLLAYLIKSYYHENTTIILLFATLSTGIMSGLFFTWTNAVTPGIGKLSDMGYLSALQSMNMVILNPTFKGIFFSAILLLPVAAALSYTSGPTHVFWMLVAATVIYALGTFGVTVFGNIPLNNLLDQANLDSISIEQAYNLRETIEVKWNRLNVIRTVSSIGAFVLLVLGCLGIVR